LRTKEKAALSRRLETREHGRSLLKRVDVFLFGAVEGGSPRPT